MVQRALGQPITPPKAQEPKAGGIGGETKRWQQFPSSPSLSKISHLDGEVTLSNLFFTTIMFLEACFYCHGLPVSHQPYSAASLLPQGQLSKALGA